MERFKNFIDNKIDIIIPIYNAFDDLVRCLESVWKWTSTESCRLILINDKSTDKRVRYYLDGLQQENVLVIHNQVNRGFPANVNIGMEKSKINDVILLNSDTVVTKGWLEKLTACAYSDCAIATVTPLSNYATLCSVPDFCKENVIPEGYTLDEYAALIERISFQEYPQIPVANGFCMYIKREVIDKIGKFDAEAFERGYGEENDFCYRAIEAGYHHVMCDDTFILHTGTRSFDSKEKQKNIEAHEKILEEKYPVLMQNVRIHCRDHPNAAVFENIRLWSRLERRRKKNTILYLVQSDFRMGADNAVGGTQLHVKDLTMGLRERYDIVVAARDGSYLNVTLYTQEEEFPFRYYIGAEGSYELFRSAEFSALYRKILENFQVNCVHIHHTKGLTLELFYEAKKKAIPIFVTLHDYYSICPSIRLLDTSYTSCIGRKEQQLCRKCLKEQAGIAETVPYIELWRNENLNTLKIADCIFVPSQSAKQVILQYYASLKEKIHVIEHGSSLHWTDRKKSRPTHTHTFHIAFLGGIGRAKGYSNAVELIQKGERSIKWFLFGKFENEDWMLKKKKNFISIGVYEREELPRLFRKYEIDLVCILSVWAETFSYTVSEAISCKVPVLVTDIGALGERVRAMDCGWVVPKDATGKEILNKIDAIRRDKKQYQKKLKNIQKTQLRSVNEMCDLYDQEYQNVIKKEYCIEKYDYPWMLKGAAAGQMQDWGGIGRAERRMQEAETQLAEITGSFTYRLSRKVVGVRFPYKRQMKSFLRAIYHMARKRH